VIGTAANAQWIVPWTDQVQSRQVKPTIPNPEGEIAPSTETLKPLPAKANPKAKALTQLARSGGAVVGSLLGGILAMLLGRRATYFLVSLLTLVASTIIFGWMNPLDRWFTTASFLFGFVGTIYFGWLPLFLPELFPTRVRATGAGISFNTGRIVAGFVALGTGVLLGLTRGDYARIGLWTGMIYAAGMAIILFTPADERSVLKE
jgi:MFS family permease